jgi:hypothetical protein
MKFLLLLIGFVFSLGSLPASQEVIVHEKKEDFTRFFQQRVLDTITNAQEIPGLKAEELISLREEMATTWNKLVQEGVIEIEGTDKEIRPCFVALQGIIEHVLSCELKKEVFTLRGVIHTPMPATPLCTAGEISEGLVSAMIAQDPKALFTVKARAITVREFLHKQGYLYVAYPKLGLAKRSEEQQNIYKKELAGYPEHLFDRPLECASIPDELIGATYLFSDKEDNAYAFAIKMTQAKDPKEKGRFGLWFGPLNHAMIAKRVALVFTFIAKNSPASFEITRSYAR